MQMALTICMTNIDMSSTFQNWHSDWHYKYANTYFYKQKDRFAQCACKATNNNNNSNK